MSGEAVWYSESGMGVWLTQWGVQSEWGVVVRSGEQTGGQKGGEQKVYLYSYLDIVSLEMGRPFF